MNGIKHRYYIPVILLCAAAVLCVCYAYFIEPGRLVVNITEIRIAGWKPEFNGLRIALLSDIHGGSHGVTQDRLREIVSVTNQQNPDIIVILGDFVSQARENTPVRQGSLKMPMNTIADNLRGFRAAHGVFAVLGNHDGWYGDQQVASELNRVGITVLENQAAVIEISGERLRILGLRDHFEMTSWDSFDPEIEAALAGSGGDIIVLEHSPDVFPILLEKKAPMSDFKLMLAGHTHGGQVRLPILGSPIVPSSHGQRYNRGHIREGRKDLFVTTGIGTSILPFRFLVPPEIAILTVYSE